MRQRRLVLERRYERPPAEIWRVVADTERGNELTDGLNAYTIEDTAGPDGTVVRRGRGRLGPFEVEWEEGFGEWVEQQSFAQVRRYTKGPFATAGMHVRLDREAGGTRVTYTFEAAWDSLLGNVVDRLGALARVAANVVRTNDQRIAALDDPALAPVPQPCALEPEREARLRDALAGIERGPFGHGLTSRLATYLTTAARADLKRIRPLALAKAWGERDSALVELCVAAQAEGLLEMRWAILCPRCRVGKSVVTNLYEMPRGVHCESCNIDYERDFAANVELVFQPARWLRELPDADFCMMSPAATPHVLVQHEVAAGAALTLPVEIAPGAYRLRTVEAGGETDIDHAGGGFPEVVARGGAVTAGPLAEPGTVRLRNTGDRPLNLVIEERGWSKDALTGDRVIAMPVFRELCPTQVLRPGDDVVIGQVTIMFSDLEGSTALYESIGDSAAYSLIRDHFAFFAALVREHDGILVKTIGDAVMAAFAEPADAARAALAIQSRVAGFNAGHAANAITIKLGLHKGECIAVTTAGTLDYFGAAVNLAARLQGQSRGHDIVISAAMHDDPLVAGVLTGFEQQEESTRLHGLERPVTFYRLGLGSNYQAMEIAP
ncbi:MAG: adenylate/guanylate cyclase domain-containing protein [Geminicoccaceae bacterium]